MRVGREPISWALLLFYRRKNIPFVLHPAPPPPLARPAVPDRPRPVSPCRCPWLPLTHFEKEYLVAARAGEARVHVLGHGPVLAPSADPQAFLRKNALAGPVILFLGQHYEYKGFRQALADRPTRLAEGAGSHLEKEPQFVHQKSISNHRPNPRCLHLGAVNLQVKTNALAACTLLCVSLHPGGTFETCSLKARSFSKPVIGCPIPAVREVINDPGNHFLVKQDPNQIAERILFILENPQNSRKFGPGPGPKVKNNYSTYEAL